MKVRQVTLLPAGEVPGGGEAVARDTLSVTTVVALVHLTLAASELRQAAALLGAVLAQKTHPLVQAVALAAPCAHAETTVRLTHLATPKQRGHFFPSYIFWTFRPF